MLGLPGEAPEEVRLKSHLPIVVVMIAAISAGSATGLLAQSAKTPAPHETRAEVPALDRFHEVIFEIWHDAWPAKNTAKLIELLPRVKSGVEDVAGAELPGILREKKKSWDEAVKKLRMISADYEAAATAREEKKLLEAAEALHMQYERLVRIVRPAVKELEDFHSSLYVLYHYDLASYSLEKVRTRNSELEAKMAALQGAKLPERQKAKQEPFDAGRNKLALSVATLKTACIGGDEQKIRAAIEGVHSAYEALAKVFE